MKKIIAVTVLMFSLLAMIGCGGAEVGEFPEVRERKLVEMSGDEMAAMLSDVQTADINQDAMRLSLDLEGHFIEEMYSTWDTSYESMTDIDLTSTIYLLLDEDITEVRLHAENDIDMHQEPVVLEDARDDATTDVTGKINVYFYNQFLYTNMELSDDSDAPVEGIENGQFKYNLGITQSMWDEIYENLSLDALDDMFDFSGYDTPQENWVDPDTFEILMEEYPGIKVYESSGGYTLMVEITKDLLLEHATDVVAALAEQQGEPMSEAEIQAFDDDLSDELAEYDVIDATIALVIEDDRMVQYAFDVNMTAKNSDEYLDMIFIIDVGVEMPEFPDDLEDYELRDFPLSPYFQSDVPLI